MIKEDYFHNCPGPYFWCVTLQPGRYSGLVGEPILDGATGRSAHMVALPSWYGTSPRTPRTRTALRWR